MNEKIFFDWHSQDMERLPTDLSTRNTGEYPSDAEEYMLSQILAENPPTKYYLSVRAMDGILTRASRRGKPLPDLLITAINGMKDWLVQTDLSATLATNNDQTLFAPAQKATGFIAEQNAATGSIGAGNVSPTLKCAATLRWRTRQQVKLHDA